MYNKVTLSYISHKINNMKYLTLSNLLILSIFLFSCNAHLSSESQFNQSQINEEVDQYVAQIMERHGIPGAAVAIIRNDSIIHKKNYGLANIEHSVPVTDATIFRVYSITKIFIAVGIFQLVEQDKLSLENSISEYLKDLPEEWKEVKVKNLLTHSSGLPDYKHLNNYYDLANEEIKELIFREETKYEVGESYEYNQTNYWLLQEIIEKVSGTSLSNFIIPNQFEKETDTVFFSSDSRDIIQNRATLYFDAIKDKQTIEHPYGGSINWATNGMNLTLKEFITWTKRLDSKLLLKQNTMDVMWQEFPFKNKEDLFTLGWSKFQLQRGTSYGFTGNLTNAYRIFPKQNLSLIFLSNGAAPMFRFDVDAAINHLAFLIDGTLKNSETYIYEKLIQASLEKNQNIFEDIFNQVEKEYSMDLNLEDILNSIGYFHLAKGNYTFSIQIFRLNTEEFPESWNAFDSLGEAYEESGNIQKAIVCYRKAIELNTANQYENNLRLKNKIEELTANQY